MDDYDGHTGLNVWLYLKQHGLEEGRDVELVTDPVKGAERAKGVVDGKYDASFIRAVDRLRALKFGAKIIEVPPMAMIEGVTLTTTTTYVKNHEDEARSLIYALIDGIIFSKRIKPTRSRSSKSTARNCSRCMMTQSGTASTRPSPRPWRSALSLHRRDSKCLRARGQARSRDQRIQPARALGSSLRQRD